MRKYHYECDRCAACCCHFFLPVTEDDKRREPLVAHLSRTWELDVLNLPPGEDAERLNQCALLDESGHCTVQASKPDVCRRFKPGSELCQWARGRAGLSPLHWSSCTEVGGDTPTKQV